jgi:hypothetical protein
MTDEPMKPEKVHTPQQAPTQWERRKPGEPGSAATEGLKHTLTGGDDVEYTEDESQQTSHLADDQQSLGSKLTGGGRDLGSEAGKEVTKLCAGCGAVTTYIQGRCSKCGYKLGTESAPAPPAFIDSPSLPLAEANPMMRNILVGAAIVVAIVVVVFLVMQLMGGESSTEKPDTAAPAAGSTTTSSNQANPGSLNPVSIDDNFHETLTAALLDVNQAWKEADVDCFIYRYNIFERTEPAQSQQITISGYIGGSAAPNFSANGDEVFQNALADYISRFSSHNRVTVNVYLEFTNGEETPSLSDRYIKYGYYYALEHWDSLGPIVDALEGQKRANGQYPHALSDRIVRPKIHTYGGLNFIANGFGYVPQYRTDSGGYIIMGSGSGVNAYYPDECSGYVLLVYLRTESEGLDVYSPSDLHYYRENITPFPYEPKKKLTNVPLEADGKPDGIACVVINGEIQES